MSEGAGSVVGPGACPDARGGACGDPDAGARASAEPDEEGRAEESVAAPSGASAAAKPGVGAESSAQPGPSSGGHRGGSAMGAVSLRVHAAKTSATEADRVLMRGLTARQGKPAFVLVEHPIVSLLTIGASGPSEPLRSPRPAGYKARVIRVSHLTKRYGEQLAVDDVSFEVGKGEVLGFLGPNGAGKSTTLRILGGFLGATSGEVAIDGHDVATDSIEARRRIGYMPEAVPLYPEMRVVEYLRFRAELKRVPRAVRRAWIDEAMSRAAVLEVAHKRIEHLSKGYRQRVGLADAIVARPPIVILDEPTAGLDPNQIREVRQLVRDLSCDHTVVLSTHILSEVEACATRVLLLHRGKIVAEGPTAEIRAMRGGTAVEFTLRGDAKVAVSILAGIEGVASVGAPGVDASGEDGVSRVVVTLAASLAKGATTPARGRTVERCTAALVAAEIGVREARTSGGSLEEVFASLTQDAPPDAGEEKASRDGRTRPGGTRRPS
jgi:ABC-2 type transport system ATP-binding protein